MAAMGFHTLETWAPEGMIALYRILYDFLNVIYKEVVNFISMSTAPTNSKSLTVRKDVHVMCGLLRAAGDREGVGAPVI
jgi:hypothetical protein